MLWNGENLDFMRFLGIEKVHRNSIKITVDLWRRTRDLNPRAGFPTYSLSRGAPSPLGYFCKTYSKTKTLCQCVVALSMAERVGFEPTVPLGITGFQDQLLKPLGHLSRLCQTAFLLYNKVWTLSSKNRKKILKI